MIYKDDKRTHKLNMSFETAHEHLQNRLNHFLFVCFRHPCLSRAAMSPVVIPQALPWLVYGGIFCSFFQKKGNDGVRELKKIVTSFVDARGCSIYILWLNTSYSYTMYICIMFKIPKTKSCVNLLTPWTASEPHCCLFGSHDNVAFRRLK